MTFVPFSEPRDFLAELLTNAPDGPGLDGTQIPLWHASIGPAGEGGKEVIGYPVPMERAIVFHEPHAHRLISPSVSAYDRELIMANGLDDPDYDENAPDDREVVEDLTEANVLSSALIDENGERTGFHTIALDIDFPVRVRETDTPGHYHLFIDVPTPWEDYANLLDALVDCGVIEEGYANASKEREATMLRLPWVHKSAPEPAPQPVDDGLLDISFPEIPKPF